MRKSIVAGTVVAAFAGGVFMASSSFGAAVTNALVYGALNQGAATTSIKSTATVPLSLFAPTSVAPLKVNSATVVTNLNADKLDGLSSADFARAGSGGSGGDAETLDGLDSTAFARSTMKTGTIVSGAASLDTSINMFVAKAVCPSGTVRTGGGAYAAGVTAMTSIPDGTLGWKAIGQFDAKAYVICLSPSGANIPGATALDAVAVYKELNRK